ncbi:cob(I)yrinic acid a,c-diamide adenosyltransferase [Amphibacillus sediminis]|uniref:cob(I)yrinic acid a,c-diamide adenosyltransferase n=1 Tax=Amphibacillus sediminis TaxID=360185 RepID=UPI000832DC3C|nr:cob(I)yrinic acid a,c-diamide adenosyltransferase [Amphibacillus sediminis]
MSIYTRTGDDGETSLISGQRVAKNDLRVQAYGTCDEANAVIGLAVSIVDQGGLTWSLSERKTFLSCMEMTQTLLFYVGSELATPPGHDVPWPLEAKHIEQLEQAIDHWEEQLPPIKHFILPSGHQASATLHHARTIVRRAERIVVELKSQLNPLVLSFLNRLSDLLFVAARYVNQFSACDEKFFRYKK